MKDAVKAKSYSITILPRDQLEAKGERTSSAS